MIALDTNVAVRCLVQDDAKQAAAATRLIGLSAREAGARATCTFRQRAASCPLFRLLRP